MVLPAHRTRWWCMHCLLSLGLLLALHALISSADLSYSAAQLALPLACHRHSICLLLPAMQPEGSPGRPVVQVEQIASEENSTDGNPYIRGIEAFNLNVQHMQRLGSASQVRLPCLA